MREGNEVALALTFAAAVGSFLVSYARAKAEILGLRGDVGIGSRAERVVVISAGLILGAVGRAAVGDLPARRHRLADRVQRLLHVRAVARIAHHRIIRYSAIRDG